MADINISKLKLPNDNNTYHYKDTVSGYKSTDATQSEHGLLSTTDKIKLDGIATGAEVNQNAFSNVKVGSTTVAADSKTDTLELVAGTNVTLTPDATNDKVTITAKDTTYSDATTSASGLMSASDKTKLNGIASGAEVNQNAFSNVVVGSTTVAADSKTDTLTLVGGANITLTPDATNDKITILLDDTVDTGEVIATDVQAGNLIVNGTSRFLNTINGTASNSEKLNGQSLTSTYSSTGTAPITGVAVASAIGTLDGTVSGSPSASKTLTAFSQTDGKVSATFGNISITKSQVSDFPTLGTAAAKNYTTSVSSGSADLVTSGAVWTAIDNLPEPMVFKGSLGTGGTITALPVDGTASIGDTYKVITAGTYASKAAKVGDTFICLTKTSSANTWELIPSGDEPSGTVTSVGISNGGGLTISGSPITSSGTITITHNNSGVTAGTYKSVTVNAMGHVTAGTNPTTLSGYGITDAKIANGTITLGSNSITPLTQHQDISGKLDKSGGTMTGLLKAQANIYTDSFTGALDMQNSNIYGVNSIITADLADNAGEGIHFYRDSTHVDTLWVAGGDIMFVPNRALGTSTTAANSQKVGRFTANPTSGQVVITDGTTGGMKSSGYTIAKSVPSNADFTNTWRPVENVLTSTSTTNSLSAAQGKYLQEHKSEYRNIGTAQDHQRVVIALCEVSANANAGTSSHTSGTIATIRSNGLVGEYLAMFTFQDYYLTAKSASYSTMGNYQNTSTTARTGEGYRPCIFTYNSKHYAGLEFFQTQARAFYWYGEGNFEPFLVAYYNMNSSTVLNTEIDESITYSTDNLKKRDITVDGATNDSDGNAINSTYLKLAGGTMTGQIVLASTGMKTYHTSGWTMDQYGNLKHQRTTNTDFWSITSNSGTQNFKVYFETGAVVANGSVTAPTFVGRITELGNYFNIGGGMNNRQSSANINSNNNGGLRTFLATSSMTTGKPSSGDGHIIHFDWDNSNNWASQISIANSTGVIEHRGQNGVDTWGQWYKVYSEYNLKSETAASGGTTLSLVTTGEKATWNAKGSGTITSVKTTAGAHTTINVTSGAANFNVPTKTSHLTNDSGFVTTDKYVEQSATTTSNYRKIVLSYQDGAAGAAVETKTNVVYVTANAEVQPSTGNIRSAGTVSAANLSATTNVTGVTLGVATTAGTTGGICLYGGAGNTTSYGIAMRTTANSGKHGYVQGDWGTYFYMAGATNRGWVFLNAGSGIRTSISCEGHIVTNGSLTLGGNATNTSGVRQVYNSTTKSLDFVFVA